MTPQCSQSLNSGQRCNAPAVNGSKFCRHHDPQRPLKPAREESRDSEPLNLPPLLDKPSFLIALNTVIHALAEGRIKRSVAETLFCSIKFANRLLNEIAEAGLSVFPDAAYDEPATVALAASGDRPKAAAPFNPARLYSDRSSLAHASDLDPSMTRFIQQAVAHSHQPSRTQSMKA
jgi:hypothetical protein